MIDSLPAPRVLLTGLAMVESARWHDGRLWFAHWGAGEVIAVDMDGRAEVMAEGPPQMGWAIDWLPDGRLITTGPTVTRREADGTHVTHCDRGGNEIAIDSLGHMYDPNAPAGACVRVLDGGEITHRIETELPCFACTLGGPEGRHLFLLCNEFEGVDQLTAVQGRRSAKIFVTEAPVPRVG